MSKVLINIDGGLVFSVITDVPDLEVLIADWDSEGADPDELISRQELSDFFDENKECYYVPYKSGIVEE